MTERNPAMPLDRFLRLVADMRASQKRWPSHPQQACIETMALEKRVDDALEDGVSLSIEAGEQAMPNIHLSR